MGVLRRARVAGPVIAVTAVGLVAGCASDAPQDTLEPKGENARTIDQLIDPVFAVAGLVFVLVLGAALLLAVKYRVRKDDSPDEFPAQVHGNTTLELTWTFAPAAVLAVVGFLSVGAIFDLNEEPPRQALKVEVIGQQWWWEYRYDTDGDGKFDDVVTANDLVIPAGEQVSLSITARDVIHSFWVPSLNGKRDAVPNRVHPWNLQADEPGEYVGQCTEYCGLSHAEMRIKTIAMNRDDFDTWVDRQQNKAKPFAEDDESEEAKGYRVFTQQLCASCHLINGINDDKFSDEDGPGTIKDEKLQVSRHAPNLTHLMARTTFAGAKFDLRKDNAACRERGINWAATDEGLRQCLDRAALEAWLRNPPAQKAMAAEEVPGRTGRRGMPSLELTEDQIDQLIAYLSTLR